MNEQNTVWTTVIRKKGDWTLVQWDDGATLQRAWVLDPMIVQRDGDRALVQDAREGLPFGPDWHEVLATLPLRLDRALKESGVWTPEDAHAKPNAVRTALMSLARRTLDEFLSAPGGNA